MRVYGFSDPAGPKAYTLTDPPHGLKVRPTGFASVLFGGETSTAATVEQPVPFTGTSVNRSKNSADDFGVKFTFDGVGPAGTAVMGTVGPEPGPPPGLGPNSVIFG